MGRWYESKKPVRGMRYVSHVRIQPTDHGKLRITYQSFKRGDSKGPCQKERTVDKVEMCLSSLELGVHQDRDENVLFYDVDEWGDCGPPGHYDDVLYIDARDQQNLKRREDKRREDAIQKKQRKERGEWRL